jgi:hypothetical protein
MGLLKDQLTEAAVAQIVSHLQTLNTQESSQSASVKSIIADLEAKDFSSKLLGLQGSKGAGSAAGQGSIEITEAEKLSIIDAMESLKDRAKSGTNTDNQSLRSILISLASEFSDLTGIGTLNEERKLEFFAPAVIVSKFVIAIIEEKQNDKILALLKKLLLLANLGKNQTFAQTLFGIVQKIIVANFNADLTTELNKMVESRQEGQIIDLLKTLLLVAVLGNDQELTQLLFSMVDDETKQALSNSCHRVELKQGKFVPNEQARSTPIFRIAVDLGYYDVAKLLVQNGADKDTANYEQPKNAGAAQQMPALILWYSLPWCQLPESDRKQRAGFLMANGANLNPPVPALLHDSNGVKIHSLVWRFYLNGWDELVNDMSVRNVLLSSMAEAEIPALNIDIAKQEKISANKYPKHNVTFNFLHECIANRCNADDVRVALAHQVDFNFGTKVFIRVEGETGTLEHIENPKLN